MRADQDLERIVAHLVESVEQRFFGKYRGFVVDNDDPLHLGRLRVRVPSLLGNDVVTGWAAACAPYGGDADQGFLFIPEPEAGVWVEFEEGDLEFPIWTGAFWSRPGDQSELPRPNDAGGRAAGSEQAPPTCKIIKTKKGHTIQFDDTDGSEKIVVVEGQKGHVITLDKDGIKLTDAKGNFIQMKEDAFNISAQVPFKIVDAQGNAIEMAQSAFTITAKVPFTIDASGQTVTIVGSTIDFNQG